jgi:hypothetical protein
MKRSESFSLSLFTLCWQLAATCRDSYGILCDSANPRGGSSGQPSFEGHSLGCYTLGDAAAE